MAISSLVAGAVWQSNRASCSSGNAVRNGWRRQRASPEFLMLLDGIRLAQQISWEIIAQSRERLYSPDMWRRLGPFSAYNELSLPYERMRRWHPLNQSLYAAYKVMLPGMLLSGKGDRALRTASTEGRYPFLDENVVDFCARSRPNINCAAGPTNGCCGVWPTESLPLNFAVARRCFAPIWARRSWDLNDPFGSINSSVANLWQGRVGLISPAYNTHATCSFANHAGLSGDFLWTWA